MSDNVKTRVGFSRVVKIADSWVAVVGGVLAMMGVAALVTPVLTRYLAGAATDLTDAGSAVPVLIALVITALIGGYVAGRIAKRRTGWHGLLSGLFALLLTGSYLITQVALQRSFLGIDDRELPVFFPMVLGLGLYHSYPALWLGVAVGFPARILAAWIGGLLARPRSAVVVSPRIVVAPPVIPPRPSAGVSRDAPTPL